ncbi:MAG TPA: SPOR domain-containing protein [Phycisphaerales bacterium]|nr:SPOR domain-containing protein [Phycisphaerales bacterium]HMP37088.1 SPOR domain-containing protein [Phycisphaerales bacterium]
MPDLVATALLPALLLIAALALGACSSRAGEDLLAAQRAYEAGQYGEALQKGAAAEASARASGNAETAESAAYIAGLAAFRLNRLSEAERHLRVAAASADRTIAGRSEAQLGAIAMKQNRPRDAAAAFQRAADLLPAEEAAKARYQAGIALRDAGDATQARTQMLRATVSPSPTVRADAQRALEETGWTLQGGCFRERANAERAAQQISTTTIARGLGPARVVPQREASGGTVYCIFIGSWATRQGAEEARNRVGRTDFFVRTIGSVPTQQ